MNKLKIDHIGIVVRSIEESVVFFQSALGYQCATELVVNTRQRVKVIFLVKEDSTAIKLVEPVDEKSSIYKFSKKGGGLHHLCLKCDNLREEYQRLERYGMRLVIHPEPGEAFCNNDIAFMLSNVGVNFELIDTDERAGILT